MDKLYIVYNGSDLRFSCDSGKTYLKEGCCILAGNKIWINRFYGVIRNTFVTLMFHYTGLEYKTFVKGTGPFILTPTEELKISYKVLSHFYKNFDIRLLYG